MADLLQEPSEGRLDFARGLSLVGFDEMGQSRLNLERA
jgi:hypothetical protein